MLDAFGSVFQSALTVLALAALTGPAIADGPTHLMRYADVHEDRIVFTYEDDLWIVSTDGGDARRITSHDGTERFAKFSPDGSRIAFTASYDGGTDVYVMDARGGVPTRLTFHPGPDYVLDWYPDGGSILFRSRREYPERVEMLYRVHVDGGLPEKLPVDQGGLASLSPDGKQLAYNRITREHRTWKRHQGGTAQDIWLGSLEAKDYRKITDWPGSDNFPMWHGEAIYFTSDRVNDTLNICMYDTKSGNVAPVTSYNDYDVKYPSMGPGAIVFQHAESLKLLDLATGQVRDVNAVIPSDRVRLRPTYESIGENAGAFRLSPGGKRMLLESRGEIFNVPVEDGDPINLTDAPASREKYPAWSPDGKWIVFISDRTGEEELYLVNQRGDSEWRQLTESNNGFKLPPVWSPDSKHIAFADKFMVLHVVDVESGRTTEIDRGEYDDGWERWGIQDYVFSPDSEWIAYTKMEGSLYESIFLYSLAEKQSHRVTDPNTEDFSPSFSPDGKYLYFLSNRTFEPVMGFVDCNHVFLNMCRPYLVVLADGTASPFSPKDSAEGDDDQEDKAKDDSGEKNETAPDADQTDDADAPAEKPSTKIDTADMARRIVAVPDVEAGNYFRLQATKDGFLFLSKTENEFLKYQNVNDHTGGRLDLHGYKLEDEEASKLMSGIANYHLSADGKKLAYRAGRKYGVVDAGKKAEAGDGKVDIDDIKTAVDRNEEFLQIFNEAWRVQRDWFYDAKMHAVDWNMIGEKYRRFVADCGNRGDLNYLIGEMIGELNAGHTYVYGGDAADDPERIPTGLLGVEFVSPPSGEFHRIARIIPGDNADPSGRSPLFEPGCPIAAGNFILAIDGEPITAGDNPYAALVNKAGKVVTMTWNDRPTTDGARTYRTRTIRSEGNIRYREWVGQKRAYVDAATNGEIGYLHLPNMMEPGLIEFAKAFYPQYQKRAFIIDERYNGGGFVGDMIIDRLERDVWAITQPREGKSIRNPERGFHGHLAVIVNEHTGSNGEYFAEAIKRVGLAPIIGMRTWGGAVGIEPHQLLVDGGTTTPPQFAPFGLDGKWLIEGHGVEPDIVVQNMPADVLGGRDPQLDKAIEVLRNQLREDPKRLPETPPYPDKAKKAQAAAPRG